MKIPFEPGWKGMCYEVIPGQKDCEACRNTGYRIMHGAPRDGRTGMPRFDYPCECGRNPIEHLRAEVIRKTSAIRRCAIAPSPGIIR